MREGAPSLDRIGRCPLPNRAGVLKNGTEGGGAGAPELPELTRTLSRLSSLHERGTYACASPNVRYNVTRPQQLSRHLHPSIDVRHRFFSPRQYSLTTALLGYDKRATDQERWRRQWGRDPRPTEGGGLTPGSFAHNPEALHPVAPVRPVPLALRAATLREPWIRMHLSKVEQYDEAAFISLGCRRQ